MTTIEPYVVPGDDLEALRDDRARLQTTRDVLDSLLALADAKAVDGAAPPMSSEEYDGLVASRHLIHLMLLERNARCANLLKRVGDELSTPRTG
jgi:hypothetical protein